DTFVESVRVAEGQSVRKGQVLIQLNVKDAQAQLADARSKLLRAQDDLRAANAGGRSDEAAKAAAPLATAIPQPDTFQRNHEALVRSTDSQAAKKDDLAANELELAKAKGEVTRLSAAKQEFDRGVKLDANRAAFQVQQAQSEVAALEEKVRDGNIAAPAD